jgi:hypothetical protein
MKLIKSLILAVAVLITGAAKAHADLFDVNQDSCTTKTVAVSSANTNGNATALFTATLVDPSTYFLDILSGRKELEIANIALDTFTVVNCIIEKSSTSANGDLSLIAPVEGRLGGNNAPAGRAIPPARIGSNSWKLKLAPQDATGRKFIPYCVNTGGVGTSKVAVTQCK